MSHVTCHSRASHYLLYINSGHHLYNITALDQLPLSSQLVPSTQQVSWSSSSSTYIGIASTHPSLDCRPGCLSEPVPPTNSDMSGDKCEGLSTTSRGDAEVLRTWLQRMCCALAIPASFYFGGPKDRVTEV